MNIMGTSGKQLYFFLDGMWSDFRHLFSIKMEHGYTLFRKLNIKFHDSVILSSYPGQFEVECLTLHCTHQSILGGQSNRYTCRCFEFKGVQRLGVDIGVLGTLQNIINVAGGIQ